MLAQLAQLSILLTIVKGKLFDFSVTANRQNFHDGEQLCRDSGYDGLAIVSSPEMYAHALRVTATQRAGGYGYGVNVGLRNNTPIDSSVTWDDGTAAAADCPWRIGDSDFTDSHLGYIHNSGVIGASFGMSNNRYALCGNNKNLPTEAHGRTTLSQQTTGVSSSPTMTKVFSYLECVLLCSQNHNCRVAEFNADSSTCKIFEAGTYTGFRSSSQSQTFVRNGSS